jgi:hypothetical protein
MGKKLGYVVDEANNSFFITDSEKVDSLPAGCYRIEQGPDSMLFFKRVVLDTKSILILPDSPLPKLLDEVNKFWSESSKYEKFKLPHKRGMLLHGKPGSGKTSSILKICEDSIKHNSLVIICNYFDDIQKLQIQKIREIEPDRPLVIVLEQLEVCLFEEGGHINVDLLNFIDGTSDINHVLFLASTTNLDFIPDTIKKRPSRFDLKVEIALPNSSDREFYFTNMIPEKEFKKIDLQAWVKATDGYTISHLKELITSHFIYGYPFKSAISNINKILNDNEREIGFNNSEE